MGARFVWLGGWPQGLGAAGGGAEFLNLYARLAAWPGQPFFGHFWPKNGPRQGGRGRRRRLRRRGFLAVWSALFWAFWPKIGGKIGSFTPVPRHLFWGQFWPFVLRFLGLFGQISGGPKKVRLLAIFGQVGFFLCWSGVSFLAFGQISAVGSTCRVLGHFWFPKIAFLAKNAIRHWPRRFFGLKKGQNYQRLGDFGS